MVQFQKSYHESYHKMSAVDERTRRKRRRSIAKRTHSHSNSNDTIKSKSIKLKSSSRSRSRKKKRIRSRNVDVEEEEKEEDDDKDKDDCQMSETDETNETKNAVAVTTDERQLRRDKRRKAKRKMEKEKLKRLEEIDGFLLEIAENHTEMEKKRDMEEDEKEQKELLEKKQKEKEMSKTQTELKSKLVNAQLYDCFSMATSDVKENIVLKLFAKLEQKEANDMLKGFIKLNSNSNSIRITNTDDKSSPWQKTFGLPGRAGIMQDIFEFVEDYERISVLPLVCRQWKVVEEKHHWKVLNISKRLTKIFENEPYRFSCCILLKLDKTTHFTLSIASAYTSTNLGLNWLRVCPKLTHLQLPTNAFTVTEMINFVNLPISVKSLILQNNVSHVTSMCDTIKHLKHLVDLETFICGLILPLEEFKLLGTFKKLKTLELFGGGSAYDNDIINFTYIPDTVESLLLGTSLYLFRTSVPSLSRLTQLKSLTLHCNTLNANVLATLTTFPCVINKTLQHLSIMIQVEENKVPKTTYGNIDPIIIPDVPILNNTKETAKQLEYLQTFHLQFSFVTKSYYKSIVKMFKNVITKLSFIVCSMFGLRWLTKLKRLKSLELECINRLPGIHISSFKSVNTLEELTINSCNEIKYDFLHEYIPTSLKRLKNLQTTDIYTSTLVHDAKRKKFIQHMKEKHPNVVLDFE